MVSIIELTVYTFDGLTLDLCVSEYGFVCMSFFQICFIGMKIFDQEINIKKLAVSGGFHLLN